MTTSMWLLAAAEQHQASSDVGVLYLAVIAAIYYAGWRISLRIHPWTHCSTCKGDPRNYGALFRNSYGLCKACGGTGRRLRRGAKPNS